MILLFYHGLSKVGGMGGALTTNHKYPMLTLGCQNVSFNFYEFFGAGSLKIRAVQKVQ